LRKAQQSNPTLAGLFGLFGLMFLWLSGVDAYRWHLLRGPTATVDALVTQARYHPCAGRGCTNPLPYQVWYAFSIPNSAQTYSYTGDQLVYEMPVRVPKATYQRAHDGRRISVFYAESDPRINQPVAIPRPSSQDWIGFGLFAILAFGVGAIYLRGRKV